MCGQAGNPIRKINTYAHFTIAQTRADFTTKTGSATREWKRCGTYKKEMGIAKLEQLKGLTLERKMRVMMMIMMMMMMMTTIKFSL